MRRLPGLRLGPIVRYADADSATVWVETDAPCEVEVAGHRRRTFTVEDHHYAILALDTGCGQRYEVSLDGERVWPPTGSPFPASRLGKAGGPQRRLVFGSCRTILGDDGEDDDPDRIDALREYALRAAEGPLDDLPDLLILLGDQVYDRKGAPETRAFIRSRRDVEEDPGESAADFEEYAHLYWEAWSDPAVRWLLSTVPSVMIFDDHEIADNWNTSQAWVEEMRRAPWWHDQVTGGLMAYWLYQHLGNLSPVQLAEDPVLAALHEGPQGVAALREFAASSDAGTYGTPGAQWSFARDIDGIRVVMIDSRNGRCLEGGNREMLDEEEWTWLEQQARGDVRHLVLGTSVPFLLPRGLHEYEQWVNGTCDGAWGRVFVPVAERIRREFQFTKWAAFPASFQRLAALVQEVAAAEDAPASVLVLSGDVHYSYIARLEGDGAPIHQIVSSPLCFDLQKSIEGGFRAGMTTPGARVGRALARLAGQPPTALEWHLTTGPWFRNTIATVELEGDDVVARLEQTMTGEPGRRLTVVVEQQLAPTPSSEAPER